jgi:hypothetical protein
MTSAWRLLISLNTDVAKSKIVNFAPSLVHQRGEFLMLGSQKSKVGWLLLRAIGVPVPLLLIF